MKSRDLLQAENGTGVLGQKPMALEPIKLEELAEVLGGKVNKPTNGTGTQSQPAKGNCGGLVCWC